MIKLVAMLAAAVSATSAIAQAPNPRDLARYDSYLAVEPTQVLTLGTAHLSEFRGSIDRPALDEALDPLLDRLEKWAPDTIAIENVSGSDCAHLERYRMAYANAADRYCLDVSELLAESGLTRAEAELKALEIMLAGGPEATPEARRELAALFLSSGDHYSAAVQWLHLDPEERVAGGLLGPKAVDRLEKYSTALNESASIGVALAVRLGHERVYPVDDHSADELYLRAGESFGPRMQEIWGSIPPDVYRRYSDATERVKQDRDMLAYLRTLNSDEVGDLTLRYDFGGGMADTDPKGVGQDYANWWQVRNLRMVANIVAAASLNRSQRTLAIVGGSHKPHYEAYLDMMHHVEVVDTMEFLAE